MKTTTPKKATWHGKSGTPYHFDIYPKETKFKSLDGNYIFAQETPSGGWNAIYIGEGDLGIRTQDKEHLACATQKGFTHYHIHTNTNEKNRKYEESDLISEHVECQHRNGGCNKTLDG